MDASPDHQSCTVVIQIDRSQFRVGAQRLSGREIRELPNPGIGPDRDVFLVTGGSSEDVLIGDAEVVEIHEGTSFFTVPKTITPGTGASTVSKRQTLVARVQTVYGRAGSSS